MISVLVADDVLVGHSGGGLEITRAADAAPELVSHLVYLAAALPLEGRLMQEALVYRDDGAIGADYDVTGMLQHLRIGEDGSMAFADAEGARALFYHDCDEATVRWAFAHLTPETAGDTATTPISVPRFWEAELPRSFIACLEDRAQPRWLADVTARRLGVEPLTIDASHSPFLSRPAELAQLLVDATTTVPVGPLKPNGWHATLAATTPPAPAPRREPRARRRRALAIARLPTRRGAIAPIASEMNANMRSGTRSDQVASRPPASAPSGHTPHSAVRKRLNTRPRSASGVSSWRSE